MNTTQTTARERLAAIPHLQIGDAVLRHDFGDAIARRHGVRIAPVACGREDLPTTLVTRNPDRVHCAECIAAAAAQS